MALQKDARQDCYAAYADRTNVLQGAVHMLLFIAYVLLLFQG